MTRPRRQGPRPAAPTSQTTTQQSTTQQSTTSQATQNNSSSIPSYNESSYQGYSINDFGYSLTGEPGESSTSMGYLGYSPNVMNTPAPLMYDNTIDYKSLMQTLTNSNGEPSNNKSVNNSQQKYSAPVVVQDNIDGVSNIFAPYIIFHNSGNPPNDVVFGNAAATSTDNNN